MQREIVIPQSDEYILHIPKEYINMKVEILVLPFDYSKTKEIKKDNKNIFLKTSGLLSSKNIDPLAWQEKMRSEWDR